MKQATFKVYGAEGHRQRESFFPSTAFLNHNGHYVVVLNADKTGTNDYARVIITAPTFLDCVRDLMGQISDGIFENSKTGKVLMRNHRGWVDISDIS